jgi:hypothetical protein
VLQLANALISHIDNTALTIEYFNYCNIDVETQSRNMCRKLFNKLQPNLSLWITRIAKEIKDFRYLSVDGWMFVCTGSSPDAT